MSAEIENGLVKLKEHQKELLVNFYQFEDFKDDEVRVNILNLVNSFNDTLGFLRAELQFEFDLDISKPIRTKSEKVLQYISEYDKSDQFFENFRKNFISKQLEIKESHLRRFQELKREKYAPQDKNDPKTNEVASMVKDEPISTNAKIMSTTKKITSKLSQSSQILQSSLVQSQLNMDELTIQNDSLTYLSDKYGYLKTVLEKSDGFINDIKLSSEKDKKRMYYALIFFGLCVLRVFWRRLFKLPVMFVLKFIYYTFSLVLGTIGIVSSKKADVDFVNTMSGPSIQQFATVSSGVVDSDPKFTSSAPITSSGTVDTIEDEDLEAGDVEFDEALSRIIDEL